LRVAPAPIEKELIWVLALSCGILGVGFYHLLTSSKTAVASTGETAGNPSRPRGVRQASRKTASRKG
jgi:hypothetical protein